MKGSEFANVLVAFKALVSDVPMRGALDSLSTLFAKTGTKTVAATCKRLSTLSGIAEARLTDGLLARDPAQLLVDAGVVLTAAGAKKAGDDLNAIAVCLRAQGDASLQVWVQSAETLLAAKATKPKAAVRKAAAPDKDSGAIVDSYIAKFTSAGWDLAAFENVLSQFGKDRSVSVAAAKAIGAQYSGLNMSKLSKPKVIAALRSHFTDRLRTRNELDVVAKTKPW